MITALIAVAAVVWFNVPPLAGIALVVGAYGLSVYSDPEHKLWRPLGLIDTWRNIRDPAGADERMTAILRRDWGDPLADYLMTLPPRDRAQAEWVLRKAKGRDYLERSYVQGDRESRVAREVELLERAGFMAEVEEAPMPNGGLAYRARFRRRKVAQP